MARAKPWTEHETSILFGSPDLSAKEVRAFLPGRSISAINEKRYRMEYASLNDKVIFWKSCNLSADQIT